MFSYSRILLYVVSPDVTGLKFSPCLDRPCPVAISSVNEKGAEYSIHTVSPDQYQANQPAPQNPNVRNLGSGNIHRLSQRLFLIKISLFTQCLPQPQSLTSELNCHWPNLHRVLNFCNQFHYFCSIVLEPRNLHFRRETSCSHQCPRQDQHQPCDKDAKNESVRTLVWK